MKSMYIGSGDIASLLAGRNTLSFSKLLQRFVGNEKPYYNAKASPIDALRTGAILEDRYLLTLDNSFYSQYSVKSEKMDVLKATLDFAKLENNKVVHFEELKTCNFDDFLKIQNSELDYIKKYYKNNYNQVQFQLLCSGLQIATLVFLVVYNYDDEENYERVIEEKDIVKFEVTRDEEVISKITDRAMFFQQIKDNFNNL